MHEIKKKQKKHYFIQSWLKNRNIFIFITIIFILQEILQTEGFVALGEIFCTACPKKLLYKYLEHAFQKVFDINSLLAIKHFVTEQIT